MGGEDCICFMNYFYFGAQELKVLREPSPDSSENS